MKNETTTDALMSPLEADLEGHSKEQPSDVKRYFLSIFFVVYFLAANLITTANLEKYKTSLRPMVHSVAVLFGIDQLWATFAGLRPMTYHSSAVIRFADGSERLYEFPRFDKMNEAQKFEHTKLRMVFYDFMSNPKGEPFRPAIARFLAQCNANPLNQPTLITYFFNYVDIPAPTSETFVEQSKVGDHTSRNPYFVYSVRANDLDAIAQ